MVYSRDETDPVETEAEPVSQVSEISQTDQHPGSAATRDNFIVFSIPALQSTSCVAVTVKNSLPQCLKLMFRVWF